MPEQLSDQRDTSQDVGPAPGVRPLGELQELSVIELRKYARAVEGFPISGREISRATRSDLLQIFKSTAEYALTRRAQRS